MFYSTHHAIDVGLAADTMVRARLFGLRKLFLQHAEAAGRRQKWDLAIEMATQAQFCREALEAEEILEAWASQETGDDDDEMIFEDVAPWPWVE